jgi:peptide/nickel transport system ATP-binding protein
MTTTTGVTTLLTVKHLSVNYFATNGTVHAVQDVSFDLKRGQILGLAGESGCGKSTLAYAIARLLRPPAHITGGEVMYYPRERGHSRFNKPLDILKLQPAELRAFRWNELAIVFQSAMNALNPVMDVASQITDVLRVHRPEMSSERRKKRALELINMVGIASDRLHSYPHELSGGMRQRAMIAIALALNPELIIMDEPTTALDVVMQREIIELIRSLCGEMGTSLIFITHDLSLLLELTDNIAIMYAGRMVEFASQYELYLHQLHPYSHGLLHSFPSLHGPERESIGIPGSPPDLRVLPPGCAFHPRCPLAFAPCHEQIPLLQPGNSKGTGSQVACHLYNPAYRVTPPSPEEMMRKYAALSLAERKSHA